MGLRGFIIVLVWLLLLLFVPGILTAAPATTTDPDVILTSVGFQVKEPLQLDPEPARRGFSIFKTEEADGARLWSQTRLVFASGLVAAAILYTMPADITGWDKDVDASELAERWWMNVSKKPVWDKDHWTINYVGHAYFGGVYYQVARKSGYSQWDSFVYTTLMSTFFWEYGLEAFAERPSIQDLVYTPISGWLCGEWAYRAEQGILANDSQVLGSGLLGRVSLFLLDPIDHIGAWVNRISGRELVITGAVTLGTSRSASGLGLRLAGSF